jgi:hypothetical protein
MSRQARHKMVRITNDQGQLVAVYQVPIDFAGSVPDNREYIARAMAELRHDRGLTLEEARQLTFEVL